MTTHEADIDTEYFELSWLNADDHDYVLSQLLGVTHFRLAALRSGQPEADQAWRPAVLLIRDAPEVLANHEVRTRVETLARMGGAAKVSIEVEDPRTLFPGMCRPDGELAAAAVASVQLRDMLATEEYASVRLVVPRSVGAP